MRQELFEGSKMAGAGSFKLFTGTIAAAVVLTTFPSVVNVSARAQRLRDDIKPMVVSEPIALFITLCLWSEQRPATCREVPLTPGAAGPGFASMEACYDGQDEALGKWRAQAGPVFGFTSMAGDGYRIEGQRCGPILGSRGDE
jgi:hypothetical protein